MDGGGGRGDDDDSAIVSRLSGDGNSVLISRVKSSPESEGIGLVDDEGLTTLFCSSVPVANGRKASFVALGEPASSSATMSSVGQPWKWNMSFWLLLLPMYSRKKFIEL